MPNSHTTISQKLLSLASFFRVYGLVLEKWICYLGVYKEICLDSLNEMITKVVQNINSSSCMDSYDEILCEFLLILEELGSKQKQWVNSSIIRDLQQSSQDVSLCMKNIKGHLYRMNVIADYIADCFSQLMILLCSKYRPSNTDEIPYIQELLDVNMNLNMLQCIAIYTDAPLALLQHRHALNSIIKEFNTRKKSTMQDSISISQLNGAERAKLICANSALLNFFNYNTVVKDMNDLVVFGENQIHITKDEMRKMKFLLNKIDFT